MSAELEKRLRAEAWNRPISDLVPFAKLTNACLDLHDQGTAARLLKFELEGAKGADQHSRGRIAWLRRDVEGARRELEGSPLTGSFEDVWYAQAFEGSAEADRRLQAVSAKDAAPFAAAQRAWTRLRAKEGTGAREILDELLAESPKFATGRLLLGLLLRSQAKPLDAAREFAKAAEADPATAGLRLLQGRSLADGGKPTEAADAFDEAAAIWPDAVDGFFALVPGAGREGLDRAAWEKLAGRLAGGKAPWWEWAVRMVFRQGFGDRMEEMQRRVEAAERALESRPESAWIKAHAARLFWSRDAARAEALLDEAARLRPSAGWIRAWRGEVRTRNGKGGALEDFADSIRLTPFYAQAYAWRAAALYREPERRAEAKRDADAALSLNETLGLAHLVRGYLLAESGKLKEALASLARSVDDDPQARRSLVPSGPMAPALDPRAAAKELEALAKGGGDEAALASLWLGELRLAEGRHAEAESELSRAAAGKLSPAVKGWAHAWRSEALAALGRGDEAKKAAQAASELNRDARPKLA